MKESKQGKKRKEVFFLDSHLYQLSEIDKIIPEDFKIYKSKGIEYLNLSSAFDTETSSFMEGEEPRGLLYCWMLGINGKVLFGRDYKELLFALDYISEKLLLSSQRRLIIFVHNLSFDFQFIRKHLEIENCFSNGERNPLYVSTKNGFEFRCSYQLSGYSLAKIGDDMLFKYKVEKKVGDLNYKLIRTPLTPLTEKELGYCINDCLVVMAYIQERIEEYGRITRLALTKTGFVRKLARKNCYYGNQKHHDFSKKYGRYRTLMESLTISSVKEYEQLKNAFCGGFTHANGFYVGDIMKNVSSFDFTSSYPTTMIAFQYPMGKGELYQLKDKKDFYYQNKVYLSIFNIEFTNLRPKVIFEHILSFSKCEVEGKYQLDNGRVVKADLLWTTITNVDFDMIEKFYTWDKMRVWNYRRYVKGYLPTDYVKTILDLYEKKTKLKGVEGKELEYMNSKERVNALYGMMVMDICREETIYQDDEWKTTQPDFEKELKEYNESKNRFTSYNWGIFVTAWARHNLYSGILEFGMDYIYSDTDSLKVLNKDKHMAWINQYNENIIKRLKKACDYHKIDYSKIIPKTIDGIEKPLGVWDYEGDYKLFKTLGSKRYIYKSFNKKKNKDEWHLTCAGVGKEKGMEYLKWKYKTDNKILEAFNDGLIIPAEYLKDGKVVSATGKSTHTYIDYETEGDVKDYLGKSYHYKELSSINLSPCEYSLSQSDEFLDYLCHIREIEGVIYHGK